MSKYHENITLAEIVEDDELKAVLKKHMPRAGKGIVFRRAKDIPLEQLAQFARNPKRQKKIEDLIAELKQL